MVPGNREHDGLFGKPKDPCLNQKCLTRNAQTSLQTAIDSFLDRLAIIDPSKILWKSKCHILTHLVEDVKRFGPPIVLSTETFEGYNSVFRHHSVLSNHHAPSKDVGMRMANMDRFKHIASGGRWKYKGDWVSPAQDIIRFFRSNDTLHSQLGWTDPRPSLGEISTHQSQLDS